MSTTNLSKGRVKAAAAVVSSVAASLSLAAAAETYDDAVALLDSLLASVTATAAVGLAGIEDHLKNLDPALRQAAVPWVVDLIVASRDEALAKGVEGVPENIRAELDGYVPSAILDAARWCTDCGGSLSLQQNTFRLGYSPAITLDHVVVFKSRDDALNDPSLWAHELKHVMQFAEWGVTGFAAKYVEDYAGVEREAAEYRWQWMKQTGFLERRKAERAAAAEQDR